MSVVADAERNLDWARVAAAHGDVRQASQRVELGLELVRGTGTAVEAALLVERATIAMRRYDATYALACAREAAAAARRARAHIPAAQVALGEALYQANSEACLVCFRAARRAAVESDDTEAALDAGARLAAALQGFGRAQSAIRAADRLARDAAAAGKPVWEAQGLWLGARIRALAFGDYARALPTLEELLERPLGPNRLHLAADVAVLLADVGRAGTARALLDRVGGAASTPWDRGIVAWARSEIEAVDARPARALAAAEEAAAAPVPAFLVQKARQLRLWALFDLGRPEGDVLPSPWPIVHAIEIEAEAFTALAAGDAPFAAAALDRAAEAWRENVLREQLRCEWAAAELRRRDGTDVRSELAGVEARAYACGLVWLVARVRRSLRSYEHAPRTRPTATALSPRQRQALDLVGEGLTTAEIAKRLGIAASTVETHIRAAREKTGARTRLQAAGAGRVPGALAALDAETRALVDLLAEGVGITEAASLLSISRSTATRRLAVARTALGARSTAELVARAGAAAPD